MGGREAVGEITEPGAAMSKTISSAPSPRRQASSRASSLAAVIASGRAQFPSTTAPPSRVSTVIVLADACEDKPNIAAVITAPIRHPCRALPTGRSSHTRRSAASTAPGLPVLRVREVGAAAGIPGGALVAVGRYAAGVLQHPRQVQQIPGHERRVAVGEVVLGTARALVEV